METFRDVMIAIGFLVGIFLVVGVFQELWKTHKGWMLFLFGVAVAAVGGVIYFAIIAFTLSSALIFVGALYLATGILIQRDKFRVKVGERGDSYHGRYRQYGVHRRKFPNPSVSLGRRLTVIFLWGVPFLPQVLEFLVEKGIYSVKVGYRFAMGDTWPTEPPPPSELLRHNRRVKAQLGAEKEVLSVDRTHTAPNGKVDEAERLVGAGSPKN